MYSIGEFVCYPMHGVGTVEAIEEHTVLGERGNYYLLRFVSGKMTALVPVVRAEAVGLRSLISAEECLSVISYMKIRGDRGSDNWNQRYRDNLERLKSGSIYGVADVIKCLSLREAEKGLSSGEKKMLLLARGILVTELAVVLENDAADIEMLIG